MRAVAAILMLVGMAMLANRVTMAFGVVLMIAAAFMGSRPTARSEDGFIAALLLLGALGAGYAVWSYVTALLG